MHDLQTVFKNFLGNWSFDREMHSSADNKKSIGSGKALFTFEEEDVLLYEESGQAIYNEIHKIPFSRQYKYRLYTNSIDVYLRGDQLDGVHYQSYQFDQKGNLKSFDPHICKDDIYNGRYELINENHFTLITHIDGPKKDNMIRTEFRRIP